ncbi:MAG: hypothetical protein H7X97_09710 [Opitutaceae bacterium]|nr:hypothetical protein [Verrucomicrobiales bacterium]
MIELALNAQVLLWLLILGVFLASGQASIFHPVSSYLAFHGLVFVIRPWLVHYLGFDTVFRYMMVSPSEGDLVTTLAVTSLSLVVFTSACWLAGRTVIGFSTPAAAPFTQSQKSALIMVTILLTPPILYSIYAGASGAVSGERLGGVYVMTGASGYTAEAQYMIGPLFCLWVAATRFSPFSIVPLLLYVAYRSYGGWSRWTIVLLFLALSLVYAWQNRSRWVPAWSLLLAIPVLLLFQTLGHNRSYFQEWLGSGSKPQAVQAPLTRQDELKSKFDTQEFANFDYLCFIVQVVPKRTGTFTYWTQYLQIFTEPIPRALWKGKPVGAPVSFFSLNSYGNFLGLTVSLPGDGWISAGWAGVVVTMAVVGGLLGLAHRWFWTHVQDNARSLCYLVAIAMIPQWYRDGGISIAKFLFWNLSPLLLWLVLAWLAGRRQVPGYAVQLPQGTRVRLVQREALGDSAVRSGRRV